MLSKLIPKILQKLIIKENKYIGIQEEKKYYTQDIIKFIETLTTYQNSIKVTDWGTNKVQLDSQTFNIKTYFSIFSALKLPEPYKLGIYYQINKPLIYAYTPQEEKIFKHLEERKVKNGQEATYINDAILRLARNPLDLLIVEDTKEGYFQYLMFYLLSDKFALNGDSCCNQIKILWNEEQINELNTWGRAKETSKFRASFESLYARIEPYIVLDQNRCFISLIEARGLNEWIEMNTYYISRQRPHSIKIYKGTREIDFYEDILGDYKQCSTNNQIGEEAEILRYNYNKIIFLDIDGVIRHNGSLLYLDYDLSTLPNNLTKQYKTNYQKYSKEELGVVYYDWDKEAIERLRCIIQQAGAKIVITSTWREKGLQRLIDFFRLYGLGDAIIGITDKLSSKDKTIFKHKDYHERTLEILKYLQNHPEIKSYIAIDDMDISKGIEDNFVQTKELLSDEDCIRCIDRLQDNS